MSRLEVVEKKEKNVEALRRMLSREAYFLQEQRNWIDSKLKEGISR
jgi:hypothetical protein